MATTQIHSNVEVNGQLTVAQNVQEFPLDPVVGQIVLKQGILYTYGDTGTGIFSWLPIGISRTTYVHQQISPSSEWFVTHNLNATEYGLLVYDENRTIVVAPSEPIDNNTVKVTFPAPLSGTAILIAVTEFSATSLISASITLNGSKVTVENNTLLVDGVAVYDAESFNNHITGADPHSQYALKTELGSVLAGFPVEAADLSSDDLLVFNGTAWSPAQKLTLVDGGNF